MIADQEKLKAIMGNPDSPTGKLVAMRKTPGDGLLETGVWYSNFSRVKTEAEARGIPLVAMWTNGDLCGFCRRFTSNILEEPFLAWMRSSKCLFWLGGSMDDNEDDKRGGTGFVWCRGPEQTVSYFPFVSVCKKVGNSTEFEFYGSGKDYDEGKAHPEGTPNTLIKFRNIMHPDMAPLVVKHARDAVPTPTAVPPAPATPAVAAGRLSIRYNQTWDHDHIARFQNALKEKGGHCPCRAESSSDTMCMCKAFMDQSTPGLCHCGAYEKYVVQ